MEMATLSRAELQRDLAEATTVVWKMQTALSESRNDERLVPELAQYAERLGHLSAVIQGTVARWALSRESEGK